MVTNQVLKVLIADDTDSDRLILETIVRKEGHQVVSAVDGLEAVAAFQRESPDLVLLDAMMPRLDGFGAARQIKAIAGERLVPIIFLTSLIDTDSLVQCLDAGGDDFLSKPYNRVILQAKIKSFNRMREMHNMMITQRDQIALHNEHLMQEQAVAKQVFDNIAHTGCLDAGNVQYFLSPLAVFNGDIIFSAFRPSGNMLVILGDFTGHGLPAAIGAMPLASTFYGMAHKGFSMLDILREINKKLKSILPIGVFCCATMVDINFRKRKIKVWNGGLPDCYILRAETGKMEPIRSRHLPLGVVGDKDFKDDCLHYELALNDRFYMWSDGILEARNDQGEMFGDERLNAIFESGNNENGLFNEILAGVQDFIGDKERDDDLSLIEIKMVEAAMVEAKVRDINANHNSMLVGWSLELEVKASTFSNFDPLPLLLNILVEVPGLRRCSGSLYTILAELYSNALEHGILRLDSTWKKTALGFTRYYEERTNRLAALDDGCIRFCLSHETYEDGGILTIRVIDSGDGFSSASAIDDGHILDGYSGRGIPLIATICKSLRYLGSGNEVEAVFEWAAD